MTSFIGYYRVSTQVQRRSGLGLAAQSTSVIDYVRTVSGDLVGAFEDVESGGRSDRTGLANALQACRQQRATLVIAKLDRLSRNLSFIAQLMESGVEFVAADMPSANKFTIHVIAAMAEYERDLVSQRTKAALQAAKSRGTKLGNPGIRSAGVLGTAARVKQADEFAARMAPAVTALRASGMTSFRRIAAALNQSGSRTARGKEWTAAAVRSVEQRSGARQREKI
ncbi:DNA invertase Pin-like site-specific DNA recombinase [Xanthomonas arboricola]|nr:DNA invertase Pin-like site-specific DNA recombinase [Xanthomonas sp. 3793]